MENVVEIKIKNFKIGGNFPLVIIAGPCVIENEKLTLLIAAELKNICEKISLPLIFKASYDKANRTSIDSFRGPGLKKGLKILKKVKEEFELPILSDVHCVAQVDLAAEVLDILQIPAFLSRQTDLILAAAKTKKIINLKKGQFLAPWDIGNALKKIESTGNKNILLTERGSCFGYNNLVVDFCSLPIMRKFGYPVVFDATHSLQLPAGAGNSSSGRSEFIPYLARAAVACGVDALFFEVHPKPEKALSDGENMVRLSEFSQILRQVKSINELIRRF